MIRIAGDPVRWGRGSPEEADLNPQPLNEIFAGVQTGIAVGHELVPAAGFFERVYDTAVKGVEVGRG
ncbi:hypothetical protein [Microbacterium sp.]|uniref:hypothetical protein n=1 Tax=Microbacterium sp. TaxID=51671 RepID=UPI0039E47B42